MSNKYYSPTGNLEVWEIKPDGYYTVEEWEALHPAPEPTKEEKLVRLDAQYELDKAELIRYYNEAFVMDDTEVLNEIKQELLELDNTYIQERNALKERE